MKNILITNGHLRKTLSITRSLGKQGLKIFICEVTKINLSSFSKYCSRFIKCPDPKKDPGEYYQWLLNTIIKYKIDVFFPTDDDAIELSEKNRSELEKLCILAIPSFESYFTASDKALSVKKAIEAGINCPNSIFPETLDNLLHQVSELKFPVVIKPRKSSGGRGIRLVDNREYFVETYLSIHEKHPYPFVQEYLGVGKVIEAGVLVDQNSELKAFYEYTHIRKYPLKFGPCTIQKPIKDPDLTDVCELYLKKLNFTGIADLEFLLVEGDPIPKFLEINPRFWNSLHAAYVAGIDFPWMYYKILTEGSCDSVKTFDTSIYCRNLLPGDILCFISSKDRFKFNPSFFAGSKNKVFDDIIDRNDPFPILGFILTCFKYLFDIHMWKFYFRR